MKLLGVTAWACAAMTWATAATLAGEPLPRSDPEAQGVSSAGLRAFAEKADRTLDSLHSFMVVRHGKVVAEGWWSPYEAESRHLLFSLSKSFTSTAVGLAVAEGKLSVDDSVLASFPDAAPESPNANLKAMRLHDLLRMSTGHQEEPKRPGGEFSVKAFLAQPVPFKPGTHFLYNTPGTYTASAMVQKATGQNVLEYLKPRLFEPLGIEGPVWATSAEGVTLGGTGLYIRTEDVAKFGQLYLQKGVWNGRQVVPAEWVAKATSRQTSNGSNPRSDWEQGYGYQFWRCRNNAFRGDGAHGQFCVVMPDQDAVVAVTSGVRNLQAVLDLVWEEILPAIKPEPLPADPEALATLKRTLHDLRLRTPQGGAGPVGGLNVYNRSYAFASSAAGLDAIALERGAEGEPVLVIRSNGAESRISCGYGTWRKRKLTIPGFPEQPAAASGAWTAPDEFTAKIALVETPFVATLRLKFESDGDRLTFEALPGVGTTFGSIPAGRLAARGEPR